MSQSESFPRRTVAGYLRFGSCRRDAVGVNEIGIDQSADQPDPLFNLVYRRAVQFEPVASAQITTQVERAAVTHQRTNLVDPGTDCSHYSPTPQSAVALGAFMLSLMGLADRRRVYQRFP